jgi:hypothetical protein
MDLKKRVEKLERTRLAGPAQSPVVPPELEVRELTIEEWNERYAKPYETLRGKCEQTGDSG